MSKTYPLSERINTGSVVMNSTDNEQRDSEAFVEEKLIDAEIKIEGALQACEDPDERGELIALYRDVIGILFRYHDSTQ